MKFGDQIKKFTDSAKSNIDQAAEQAKANASRRLHEVLGDDARQIKSIKLDLDSGKFFEIDASQDIVDRLRSAGLVKEQVLDGANAFSKYNS